MWTVTRQRQWPDGDTVVEISEGGIDYVNPDALAAKYPGEMDEYADPREAAEAAIRIAEAWKSDSPGEDIQIAHGATGGFTMPFSGGSIDEKAKSELREWAGEQWESVDKCDQCGEAVAGRPVTLVDYGDDWKFCGENCAERWWEQQQEPEEEEDEDERVYAYHTASRLLGRPTSDPT